MCIAVITNDCCEGALNSNFVADTSTCIVITGGHMHGRYLCCLGYLRLLSCLGCLRCLDQQDLVVGFYHIAAAVPAAYRRHRSRR
jgi:hypothetical protein